MKTYKSAKAILRASLRDIEEGHWCKGALAKKDKNDEGYEGCTLKKDPLGCALGLISMHGGNGYEDVIEIGGKKIDVFYPDEPAERAPDGVLKARDALARAIPKRRLGAPLDELNGYEKDVVVADYNDQDSMTKARAAKWFSKALELV